MCSVTVPGERCIYSSTGWVRMGATHREASLDLVHVTDGLVKLNRLLRLCAGGAVRWAGRRHAGQATSSQEVDAARGEASRLVPNAPPSLRPLSPCQPIRGGRHAPVVAAPTPPPSTGSRTPASQWPGSGAGVSAGGAQRGREGRLWSLHAHPGKERVEAEDQVSVSSKEDLDSLNDAVGVDPGRRAAVECVCAGREARAVGRHTGCGLAGRPAAGARTAAP